MMFSGSALVIDEGGRLSYVSIRCFSKVVIENTEWKYALHGLNYSFTSSLFSPRCVCYMSAMLLKRSQILLFLRKKEKK